MKNRKKIIALSSALSILLLAGCSGSNNDTVEIEGQKYVKTGEEYVKIDLSEKTFEPGTHTINYLVKIDDMDDGTNIYFSAPEVPEGYKIVGVTTFSDFQGYDSHLIYVFVNDKKVSVQGTYDEKTNTVSYNTPGVVVEELTLDK